MPKRTSQICTSWTSYRKKWKNWHKKEWVYALLYLQTGRMPWVRLSNDQNFCLFLYSILHRELFKTWFLAGGGLLLERSSSSVLNWLFNLILPTSVNLFLTLEHVSLSQWLTPVWLKLFKILKQVFYYYILFMTVCWGLFHILLGGNTKETQDDNSGIGSAW